MLYNDKKYTLLVRDEYTNMIFIYTLLDYITDSVLGSLKEFLALVKRQYDLTIYRIHRDNNRALQKEHEQ